MIQTGDSANDLLIWCDVLLNSYWDILRKKLMPLILTGISSWWFIIWVKRSAEKSFLVESKDSNLFNLKKNVMILSYLETHISVAQYLDL